MVLGCWGGKYAVPHLYPLAKPHSRYPWLAGWPQRALAILGVICWSAVWETHFELSTALPFFFFFLPCITSFFCLFVCCFFVFTVLVVCVALFKINFYLLQLHPPLLVQFVTESLTKNVCRRLHLAKNVAPSSCSAEDLTLFPCPVEEIAPPLCPTDDIALSSCPARMSLHLPAWLRKLLHTLPSWGCHSHSASLPGLGRCSTSLPG